jgi:hypothetical protein
MKQYSKQMQPALIYSAGAMESEEHFKNGATPRSHTSRGNLIILIFCLLSTILFQGCSNDGLLIKKFVKRMNAREVNAASKYIYPGDHANLYFFNTEVFEKTPNLLLKLKEKKDIEINGQKGVAVKIECKNVSPFFVNYMSNLNKLDSNNYIVDTIFVKETDNGNKITFDWSTIKGENLYLANIREETDGKKNRVSTLNIRSGKGKNNEVIGQLKRGNKIVVDEYSDDPEWFQCFIIDYKCNIIQGYIKKSPDLVKKSLFFSLGIFDSFGLLLAVVIIVILAFPIIYMHNIVEALWNIPTVGIVLTIVLILGLIYTVYQLLENILFELFLINLPY